ncbi:MAG: VOC family protein [Microthrixaceae bacterium]
MTTNDALQSQDMKHSIVDVAIVVSDAEAAVKFYRDALGLENFANTPLPDGGTVHRFSHGESQVKIIEHADGRENDPLLDAMSERGIRYLTLYVSDLESRVQAARDASFEVLVGPTEVRPNFWIAMLNDPDGNRIELIETPLS